MATNMTNESLVQAYSDYLLKHGKKPNTVFVFCEEIEATESEFYGLFSSIYKLEAYILDQFCVQTVQLISEIEDYSSQDAKTKLLSFYYTIFEQMNLNRSLVLVLLESHKYRLATLKKFDLFRKSFRDFVDQLDIKTFKIPEENLAKLQQKGLFELAWIQFMATLKFWLDDESPNFEQTDIFIEKSVHASFELVEMNALKNVIDFGKFIWHERFSKA